MVKLECFKLQELKDIFIFVKKKYNVLEKYKVYQLNKFDLITLLRNDNQFIEDESKYLYFKKDNVLLKFTPEAPKRIYKGDQMKGGFTFQSGSFILNFN